jgi:hypothetical protein
MNEDHRPRRWSWWVGILAGAGLIIVGACSSLRMARAVTTIPIRVDRKFTPWLGPISLRNETLRKWVFVAAHKICPNGMVEVVMPQGYLDIRSMAASFQSAGLPVRAFTFRHDSPEEAPWLRPEDRKEPSN